MNKMNYQIYGHRLMIERRLTAVGWGWGAGRAGGIKQKKKKKTHGHRQQCGDCRWQCGGHGGIKGDGQRLDLW